MNNKQEVKVRTGALTKGTRHQRDKCADLENQAPPARAILHYWIAAGGPRGSVRWKSVGAFLCRAKAKRRKAVHVGQAGRQQRKPNFRRNVWRYWRRDWNEVCWILPMEVCRVPRKR